MLSKKENTYKNKKGVRSFWEFHIVPREEVVSVFAKRTTLNVQSSKYIFTYFNVNYEFNFSYDTFKNKKRQVLLNNLLSMFD